MTATGRRAIKITAGAVMLTALVVTYALFDPGEIRLFPRCPFLMLTGLKCPGCGSQRAIHALLGGDITTAWRNNAMMIISLPFIALLLVAQYMRVSHPRFYHRVNSRAVILSTFAIVVLWWITRNIFNL